MKNVLKIDFSQQNIIQSKAKEMKMRKLFNVADTKGYDIHLKRLQKGKFNKDHYS